MKEKYLLLLKFNDNLHINNRKGRSNETFVVIVRGLRGLNGHAKTYNKVIKLKKKKSWQLLFRKYSVMKADAFPVPSRE